MGGYRSLAALRMIQEILNVVNIEAENKFRYYLRFWGSLLVPLLL